MKNFEKLSQFKKLTKVQMKKVAGGGEPGDCFVDCDGDGIPTTQVLDCHDRAAACGFPVGIGRCKCITG